MPGRSIAPGCSHTLRHNETDDKRDHTMQPDSAPPDDDAYPTAWKPAAVRKAEAQAEANPIEGSRRASGAPAAPPEPPAAYPSNWTPKGTQQR
jgi:hypothetical protein